MEFSERIQAKIVFSGFKITREVLGFEIRAWSVVEILPVVRNKSD
jgi:hypothetical protein